MPLQIRRGTEAERSAMSVPLAPGEPLFITDPGAPRLYIGNGTTLGGVLVSGYGDENAVDAVGIALSNGSHQNITFTYGLAQDVTNRIDASVDLSNYQGVISADAFKGSVFADDSTLLLDATSAKINLDGTVKGNIIPDSNEAYDIGSPSFKFKDLYLSGSSLWLGTAQLTASGSAVNLPSGSTIGGESIATFTAPGANVNFSIVGDDSSIIVNTSTNTVSGNFIGNLQGSVFGDDSSLIIDAIDNVINIAQIISDSGSLSIGSANDPTSLTVVTDQESMMLLQGITDGTTPPNFTLEISKGTSDFPTALIAGDEIGGINVKCYDGSAYKSTLAILSKLSATAVMSDTNPESELFLAISSGGNNFSIFNFQGNGTFVAPGAIQLAVYADDAARSAAIPSPVQGMTVFMQSGTAPTVTNKTVVYDGSAWVALH